MMKFFSDILVNFIVRMLIGISLIFFLNQFLLSKEITVNVGINPVTAITAGTLGVPGVCMLYGMVFYQNTKMVIDKIKTRGYNRPTSYI